MLADEIEQKIMKVKNCPAPATLRVKMPKEQTIKINYNGLQLEISISFQKGIDESLLFIHGFGCSKQSFKDIWEFPQFKKYTILTFDLLGFGDSSKTNEFSYTIEEHAEICKLVIEKLDIEKINLVGHSMGGAISLILLRKIPDEIISFSNLEGNLIREDCFFSGQVAKDSFESFKKKGYNEFASKVKEINKSYYNWFIKSNPYAAYMTAKSLVELSNSRKLLKIFLDLQIKKSYIYGEESKDAPVMKLLNNVQTIQIPKSGHFMMTDNPKEFYPALLSFISKIKE